MRQGRNWDYIECVYGVTAIMPLVRNITPMAIANLILYVAAINLRDMRQSMDQGHELEKALRNVWCK